MYPTTTIFLLAQFGIPLHVMRVFMQSLQRDELKYICPCGLKLSTVLQFLY